MNSVVENIDCMQGMKQFEDKYFDIAICDPPYFEGVGKMGYFGERNSKLNVKRGDYQIPNWDNNIPDDTWLQEVCRVSKNQIIWGINYFTFFHTPGRIVWDKVNGNSPFSDCEIASCTFHDSVRLFSYMWNGMMQAESISNPRKMQGNKKLNEKRIHPTQKPVNLYKLIIDKYTSPGQKILSTHVGSGSDRIAAYDLGREFYGFELDPIHFDAQNNRFNKHISQFTLHLK